MYSDIARFIWSAVNAICAVVFVGVAGMLIYQWFIGDNWFQPKQYIIAIILLGVAGSAVSVVKEYVFDRHDAHDKGCTESLE